MVGINGLGPHSRYRCATGRRKASNQARLPPAQATATPAPLVSPSARAPPGPSSTRNAGLRKPRLSPSPRSVALAAYHQSPEPTHMPEVNQRAGAEVPLGFGRHTAEPRVSSGHKCTAASQQQHHGTQPPPSSREVLASWEAKGSPPPSISLPSEAALKGHSQGSRQSSPGLHVCGCSMHFSTSSMCDIIDAIMSRI